jgi:hypothetical protein
MKIDGNTPITLNVTLGNVTVILSALGALPYDQVAGTVAMIQQQTALQINESQSNKMDPPPDSKATA